MWMPCLLRLVDGGCLFGCLVVMVWRWSGEFGKVVVLSFMVARVGGSQEICCKASTKTY